MNAKKVFDFYDYKVFLGHLEQERSHISRGFRSRLAEEAGCNNAFISQVLNTHANFSLEQALKICGHFKLYDQEERYFLLLVEYSRAGTPALRKHFKNLLDEIREQYLNIKGRVKEQAALSPESQATYYSQWYYSAIHMIVTVPQFRTVRDIAKGLKLNTILVEKVVTFLLSCGLLIEKNGHLFSGPSYLHLDRDSPNISKHHANWRLTAINSLQNDDKADVHYSTVSTLSKKDVETIRSKFVQEIQNYVQTVSQSKEETMYCFNLDFFKMVNE
jgi:uncharacterized protein (TIGR02147 family)